MLGLEARGAFPSDPRKGHPLIERKLGRIPDRALRAMDDYGLDDCEIGRYFDVTPSSVRRLRRALGCPEAVPGLI